jgi:hypothetical protein
MNKGIYLDNEKMYAFTAFYLNSYTKILNIEESGVGHVLNILEIALCGM